jgi:rubrerythrin
MRHTTKVWWIVLAAVGLAIGNTRLAPAAAIPAAAAAPKNAGTLTSLQAAYAGEINAQARYLGFAQKAYAEGYLRAAKLFKALAASEGVQARHQARVIEEIKGVPKVEIISAAVGSTRANLEAALKAETHDVETTLPAYLDQAQKENNLSAVHSFRNAKTIEGYHLLWLKTALGELPAWKSAKENFFVCNACGYIVAKLTFEYCPICKAPKNAYSKI